MSKDTILILIAVAVGVGIVAVIAYYVARFMRGSIKLSMSRTTFNPGDAITGSFDLLTKKLVHYVLNPYATQTDTSANRIYAFLIGRDCNFRPGARFTGDRLDFNHSTKNLWNFDFK